MPQVLFSKVELTSIGRKTKGGGEAKFKAALSKAISKVMKWGPVADNDEMVKPGGSLMAKNMTLRNDEGELATFEYVVDLTSIGKFEIHRLEKEGTRGKGTALWVVFTAKFVDIQGCALLESYQVVAGESKGTLTVEYQPESKQVDMTEVSDAKKQQALPGTEVDNDPDEDEDDDEDED